jgi:hypothetical protein
MPPNIFNMVQARKFARALAEEEELHVEEDGNETCLPFSPGKGKINLGGFSLYSYEQYMGALHLEIAKQGAAVSSLYDQQEAEEDQEKKLAISLIHRYRAERDRRGEYKGRDTYLAQHYSRDAEKALENLMALPEPLAHLTYHQNECRNTWQGYNHAEAPPGSSAYSWLQEELEKGASDFSLERILRRLFDERQEEESSGGNAAGDQGQSGESPGSDRGEDAGTRGGESEDQGGEQGSPGSEQGAQGGEPEAGDAPPEPTGGDPGDQSQGGQPGGEAAGGGEGSGSSSEPDQGAEGDAGGASWAGYGGDPSVLEGLSSSSAFPQKPPQVHSKGSWSASPGMYTKPLSKTINPLTERELRRLLENNSLSKSVRRYLVANKQVGYEYGKKRGKICAKNISRLYSGSPTEQPRIFKERNSSRVHLDTAVMILGDASGSMSGWTDAGCNKYALSAACQISLSSVLVPLQIPHAMIQFTTSGVDVVHYNMKSFDESRVSTEELVRRYASTTVHMNSNSDGESLLYAASILAQRPESRKLLIVLSDGAPAHMGGDDEYLRDVVRMLEGTKGLELVAIGIRDDNVSKFYKQHRVVKDLSQLEPQLLEVLKENLLRR